MSEPNRSAHIHFEKNGVAYQPKSIQKTVLEGLAIENNLILGFTDHDYWTASSDKDFGNRLESYSGSLVKSNWLEGISLKMDEGYPNQNDAMNHHAEFLKYKKAPR